MAADKLIDSAQLDGALESTADAIRSKTGGSASLTWDMETGFKTAVEAIVTPKLQAKTGVVPTESSQTIKPDSSHNGLSSVQINAISSTYVGSGVARKSSSDLTASGKTVTAPAGYYASDASKSVADGGVTQNAPTIDASTGLVTATVDVSEGYVEGGTESETLQLTTKAAATINTSASNQAIAAGTYLTGKQTIRAVTTSGIEAANIKDGVVVKVGDAGSATRIKNVTGTFTSDGTIAAADVRSGKIGYSGGDKITGTMADSSVSQGTTTVSGTTATRGTASWGTGYISQGSIGAATFANSATSGKTYVDISGTAEAPVLVSGGSLFINKGYTDDLKISLAKLVPDGASADLASDVILSGHSAYDNDGNLIAGNIPTKTSSDLTASGAKVTVPAGYYASTASKSVAGGEVVQNTPTIDASTGIVTASADVSAGYVASGTKTETLQLTTKAAATINTSTSNQTIAAGTYLTGTQTFRAVTTSGIDAANIKNGAVIKVGDAGSATRIKNVTGTFTSDGTIAATDVRSGKIGYSKGSKITGTMADSSVSQGTTTVSGTTATRGTASWGTGYIAQGSIGAATFSSSATSGKTYVDISGTTAAPVLASGGSLFINKGYTDDLKISLAKLMPDGASADLSSGVILSGYSAYDSDGSLVTGDIPTKTSSDLTVSGAKVTVPAGYYASAASESVATGAYSADSSASTNSTVTPSVGLDDSATESYGFTTTKPSGTSGTAFLTVNPNASATAWSVTPRAKVTTAGYLAAGNKTGTEVSQKPSVAAGTSYYVPVVSPTFSGGGLTNTTNYSGTPTVTLASGTDSNMSNVTIGAKDETNYPYYFKVNGSTAKMTGTTKVTRAAVKYTNDAGVIAEHDGTQAIASGTSSPSVTVNAASSSTYVGIKSADLEASGTASATTTVAPGTVSIAANTTAVSGKTRLALSPSTATSGIDDYYIAVRATAAANSTGTTSDITGTASASVSAAGYAPTSLTGSGSVTGTATAKTSSKNSSVYYIPVTSGGYSASVSSHTVTAPLVMISNTGSGRDLLDYDPPSGTDGEDYWTFGVGGSVTKGASHAKGKATIGTAGWIPTGNTESSQSNVDIGASLEYELDGFMRKIAGTTTISGTTTKTPSIAKQAISISGVTDAANGSATTTAPSSGVYVAVKSAANTGTLTATPSVTTAGYGTSSNHGIAAKTATVGAAASSVTYVPIKTANPAFDGGALSGTATASGTNLTLSESENDSGASIKTACTATRAAVLYKGAVSGWVSVADNASALAKGTGAMTAKTYYVNGVTLTAGKSFDVTVPNGSASSTITFHFAVDSSNNVTVTES